MPMNVASLIRLASHKAGLHITLLCDKYAYTGILVLATENWISLDNVQVLSAAGVPFNPEWHEAQRCPNRWYIPTDEIRSFGILAEL